MKKLITILFLFNCVNGFAQNVGIGETLPTNGKLTVKGIDSAVLLLHNNTAATENKTGLYFKTGSSYSGALATIGNGFTHRLGLFTFGGSGPASLLERMSILDGGNVGIGTTNPMDAFSVKTPSGVAGISHTDGIVTLKTIVNSAGGFFGTTSVHPYYLLSGGTTKVTILATGNVGIGDTNPAEKLTIFTNTGAAGLSHTDGTVNLKTIVNSAGGFVGTTTNHPFYLMANGSTKVTMLQNGNVGILNPTPTVPLSFASSVGDKISLWGSAPGSQYGFGIQGGLMQIFSDVITSDVALGYGGSDGFVENMRIKGNGRVGIGTSNPTAGLVVNKVVGNTNAIFASNTSGVSIQSNYPGIGFNTFYNGGSAMISSGGAGYIGADPTSGRIILANTNANATAGAFNALQDKMWIANDGTVSMGSSNLNAENNTLGSGYKLKVFGKIISEEVRVQLKTAWPDYVFEKNYHKLSIDELEKYVTLNKHLPNIPSAKEIENDGQHLGEIQRKMLEKIEELSLYVIELKKEIDLLKTKK